MLRSLLKLKKPLTGAISTVRKQHGVLAGMVDVQSGGAAIRQEPERPDVKTVEYLVEKTETPNNIHVNVEKLSEELQNTFVDTYIERVRTLVSYDEIVNITFNFVSEDVFMRKLYIPIRKLGFISSFQRYNDNRGLAHFKKKTNYGQDIESRRIGSFNRMAYTKNRKTDIQTLIM